jgi:CDP-6-deoxy-D-xylo-4-hexulose-3-dehydrase
MTTPIKWPLAVSPFTVKDRLRIAWWLLTQDRYTMGEKVAAFEAKFAAMTGRFTLGVSSGSMANQLVFDLWKFQNPGKHGIVIAPAVTWSTSITPAMHAGLEVRFCDINTTDFSFDYEKLEGMLKRIRNQERSAKPIIWPTALIGRAPDMGKIHDLANRYGAEVFLDSCENTLSMSGKVSILASAPITTTSCFFSHQVVAIEFGFVFFQFERDYEIAKMWRNHGMSRSLPSKLAIRQNFEASDLTIDPTFLFAVPGHNMRPSEINAMFGLIDFERMEETRVRRNTLYKRFWHKMGFSKHFLVPPLRDQDNAYCLPAFTLNWFCEGEKKLLRERGIEVRPIVGGNLTRQPAFKRAGVKPEDFPNAEWVHRRGFYVGLHHHVTEKQIDELASLFVK